MKTLLNETSIPVNFTQVMFEKGVDWNANDTNKMFDIVFFAISDTLGVIKNTEMKTAIAVKNLKGELLLGAVVTYHKNENEDMPGNWSYEFTFDMEDLKDARVIDVTDAQFQRQFAAAALNLYSIKFTGATWAHFVIESCVTTLTKWLDVNAKEDEEVEVEEPGYFLASVVVEKGEKIISIVPDGAMKRLIKDDSAIEQ